eukprot:725599-Amphidinium_carterae.1
MSGATLKGWTGIKTTSGHTQHIEVQQHKLGSGRGFLSTMAMRTSLPSTSQDNICTNTWMLNITDKPMVQGRLCLLYTSPSPRDRG